MNYSTDDELYQILLNSSFRFLSFRPRSEKEVRDFLRQKLQKKKLDDPRMLEKIMKRLADLEYLDDEKFARWWLNQRRSHQPKGNRIIIYELQQKGVPREIIEMIINKEVCQSIPDRVQIDIVPTEEEAAHIAIVKKLSLWKKLPKLARKQKIYEYLARRGFSSDIIYPIIDDIMKKDYNNSA